MHACTCAWLTHASRCVHVHKHTLLTHCHLVSHTHNQTQGRFVKGGANHGLLARGICQLLSVSDKAAGGQKKLKDSSANANVGKIKVRRFFHPEEVDQDAAYEAASHWEVYWSDVEVTIDADDVVGRCTVGGRGLETGRWRVCVCGVCPWCA